MTPDFSPSDVRAFGETLFTSLEKVIVGKRSALELITIGLLCQGHILIEDVPGVGKTVLARALAKSLNCSFSRLQFTPDMLPSDVTGASIFNQETRQFEFRPGPIFHQIVLTDEINRATPKTQAALLEAMEERQVTVDGQTRPLPSPFLVLATQNPIEYEGTFPLPEAQLDRFLLRLRMGYPASGDEIRILSSQQLQHPLENLTPVFDAEQTLQAAQAARRVHVAETVKRYIVEITQRTRQHSEIYLGASPRGSLALFRAAQARAALLGRDYLLPDDVKSLVVPTLAHRLILSPAARLREVSAEKLLQEILLTVPVPGGDLSA